MYCKFCGKENSQDVTYCINCGENISTEVSNESKLNKEDGEENEEKSTQTYCEDCGANVEDRYCTSCCEDTSHGTLIQSEAVNISESDLQRPKSKNSIYTMLLDRELIKASIIAAAKMLVIGFVICFLVFTLVKQIDDVKNIYNGLEDLGERSGIDIARILPNALDVFALSLQMPTKYSVTGKMWGSSLGETRLDVKIHLLILLFIPIIMILIAQYKKFRNTNSTRHQIWEYTLSSVIFSVIMNILLIFNGKKIMRGTSELYINATGRFKLLPGLIICFIIVFVIQLVLSILFKRESLSSIPASNVLSQSFKAIGVYTKNMNFFVLFFLIMALIIILGLSIAGGIAFKEILILVLAYIIICPYVFISQWMYLSGNSVMASMPTIPSVKGGMLTSWNSLSQLGEYMGFEKAVPFYILTLLFIIAAIYIIIEALNKISNEKFFAKLAYSSAGIAIINAGLGYLGTTSMRFKEDSELLKMVSPVPLENLLNMSLGYSIINILLINTIFIFAIGVLLYYIRQKNIIFKILQFIESKKRIIKICYLVLILIVGAIACINLLSSLNHMKDMINVPNMFNVPL